MPDFNNNTNKGTSTHIRTLYSKGFSYLTLKFFNVNLSLSFVPHAGQDASGIDKYNSSKIITTTINYENAALLYHLVDKVLNKMGPSDDMSISIECNGGARLIFERKPESNNQMATWLIIEKNGEQIPFKFDYKVIQTRRNGQIVTEVIESGLTVLMKTIEGYLTGINADRHLNKLTDDFAKAQENKQPDANGSAPQNGGYQNKYQNNGSNGAGGYQKKQWNNYKKSYNNNGGGYQNNYNQNNNQTPPWETAPSQSIGMSSYNIQG